MLTEEVLLLFILLLFDIFLFMLVYDCSFSNVWREWKSSTKEIKNIVPLCWSWTHLLLLDIYALFSLMFIVKAQYVAVTEVFNSPIMVMMLRFCVFIIKYYCSLFHLDFLSFLTALFRIDCDSCFRVHKHEWYLQYSTWKKECLIKLVCCCLFAYFSLRVVVRLFWSVDKTSESYHLFLGR
jgi:hypothetical protein